MPEARAHLLRYVSAVVNRYKDHPALELWQVENEAFINFKFGECEGFDESAVEDELAIVRSLDTNHKIVMTDSGELSTWRKPSQLSDIFGTTLYRIVRTPSGFIWSYDWLPAGFYKLKARLLGLSHQDFFVAELQAEPWFVGGDPTNTPIEEQEKTMNVKRIQKHIDYAERVGSSRAYLWGVEWWYWMKEVGGDDGFWGVVREL